MGMWVHKESDFSPAKDKKEKFAVLIPVREVSAYFTTVAYVESVQLVQPVRNRLLTDRKHSQINTDGTQSTMQPLFSTWL